MGLAVEDAQGAMEGWLAARGYADISAAPVLTTLAREGLGTTDEPVRPERLSAMRLLLRLVAEDRPLVLWLDGEGGAVEAVATLGSLLAARITAPVLTVLTLDEGAPDWTDAARDRLDGLLRRGDVLDLLAGVTEEETTGAAVSA